MRASPRSLLPLNLTYQTTPRTGGTRGWLDDSDKYSMAKAVGGAATDQKRTKTTRSSSSSSSSAAGSSSSDENNSIGSAYAVARGWCDSTLDLPSPTPLHWNTHCISSARVPLQRALIKCSLRPDCSKIQSTSKEHNRSILSSKISLRINTMTLFNGTPLLLRPARSIQRPATMAPPHHRASRGGRL